MGIVRLLLGVLVFALSLLTLFRAPEYHLWYVAISVSEWGAMVALLSLLLLWPGWQDSVVGILSACLGVGAAFLVLLPLYRAHRLAQSLPDQLQQTFGSLSARSGPGAPVLTTPFSIKTLLLGIASPSVPITTLTYKTVSQRDLLMDVYCRHGLHNAPGIIMVHGGSWQSGDRHQLSELNRYLAARGYIVAAPDYRLAPQALFPEQIQDVRDAIAALKAHANQFGLDSHRLIVAGRSAGAQIALYTAYTAQDPDIRGAIDLYGPLDLVWGYQHPTNPWVMDSCQVLRTYLGGSLDQRPEVYTEASPVNHVNANTPPTLMIHGTLDALVSPHHSELLAARMKASHRPSLYLAIPWGTHGCDAHLNGPSGQLSTYAIERFIAAVTEVPPQ